MLKFATRESHSKPATKNFLLELNIGNYRLPIEEKNSDLDFRFGDVEACVFRLANLLKLPINMTQMMVFSCIIYKLIS